MDYMSLIGCRYMLNKKTSPSPIREYRKDKKNVYETDVRRANMIAC